MPDQVKVSLASFVIGKDGKHSEGARVGAPPGFSTKHAVPEVIDEPRQTAHEQEVAPLPREQGGGEELPTTEQPSALADRLPELPQRVRMPRGGRPTVMTPPMKEKVWLLLSLGLSRRQTAYYLGIDHTTIQRAAERDPDFAYGLEQAEGCKTADQLLFVVAESRRNWRAAAWLLEHAPKIRHQPTEEDYQAKHARRLEKIRENWEAETLSQTLREECEIAKKQREVDRNHAAYLAERELAKKEKAEREARRAKRLAEEEARLA